MAFLDPASVKPAMAERSPSLTCLSGGTWITLSLLSIVVRHWRNEDPEC